MNRQHPILLALTFLFALFTYPAQAETLTEQKVQSFISSLNDLQGMESRYEDLPQDLASDEDEIGMENMSSIFSTAVEKMRGHGMYDDLQSVVREHGFDSPENWGETGDRIFRAWTAIEMGQQSGQMNQEMARAMEEINNNPNMTEAQKQQMRQMMGGAMSAMDQAAKAPEADKQAVRPHMEALRSATQDKGEY
ncbi:hypothetical protein [Marinobacter confluentis]|uniref:Uncharacterized protein n=1 Tax=Marinobacter confluentis TaxID=1697557 RepID=A0A4Z1C057_9GAMM|nr:hypothetical protein [Marinobacter confluentis]TGN39323.1 hypothetical protein E5Q11_11805 [Marinobacter confluentis]